MPILFPLALTGVTLVGGAKTYLTFKKQRQPPLAVVLQSSAKNSLPADKRGLSQPKSSLKGVIERVTDSTMAEAGRQRLQKSKTSLLKLFSNDAYAQSVKEISLDAAELSEEEQITNQFVKLSSLLMGSSVLSALVYPPLLLLHIPPLLYIAFPMYQEGYQDIVQKRQITTTVVDVSLSLGCLVYVPFQPSIIVISTVGSWLYALTNKMVVQSKDNTRKRLTNLFGQQPQRVWILQDGLEIEVPYESIGRGDIVVVQAGQMVPVDGVVTQGIASVDQQMLTGEAQPAEKSTGDAVFAATIVLTGKLCLQVEKTGKETAAAQIGEILQHTSAYTSSVQLRGKEISDKFAPPTLGLGALATLWVSPGAGLAVLLSGIGYSMKMLGPLSVLNFLRLAAQQGILIKDGRALEQISQVDTVVFDKTGTLTLEQPRLGAIHCCATYTEAQILTYAAVAEARQTHPIARAILQAAHERQLSLPAIDEAAYQIGYGIKVVSAGQTVRVGSQRYMALSAISIPPAIEQSAQTAHAQGASVVYVALGEQLIGALELRPTLRPEAKRIVAGLQARGLTLYIISGDQQRPTQALADELGIPHYFAETLPEHKAEHIVRLQAEDRRVCFIGDGINDSIALKKAQVSISLKGASTIATDTAQVILMDQTLNQLEQLFVIAEKFERNMQANLLTSVVPGAVTIAGAFAGLIGFGAAMGLSLAGGVAGAANAILPLFEADPKAETA